MKLSLAPLLALTLWTAPTLAQEPACASGSTCVPPEDMRVFVALLHEKKCLQDTKPAFTLDPITVTTDRAGRVFTSGTPYKLRMRWCSYDVQAEGKVTAQAAVFIPPQYGFRFRPKAYLGYLPLEALEDKKAGSGIDAGVLIDFLHWKWSNLNAAVGVRSGGLGVGVDIIRNFGAYLGYAITWGGWRHNPNGGLWFAF